MKKKLLIGFILVLIVAQFIQPAQNNGTAEAATDITRVVPVPDSVMSLLKTACYDCHSNHTKYPWYSKITPVNWWLNNHIEEGKRELNFSTFANSSFRRKNKKLGETAEHVENHEMPLNSYTWLHAEARLSEAQRKTLIDWAHASQQKVMQDSLQMAAH